VTTSPIRRLWGELAPIQPLAAWGTAEAPPKEFLVFKFGPNHATLGGRREVVTLTPKRAQAIVAEWKRRRISGAFDYEHAVTQTNPEGTPAAGWFGLAVRADGLWAVGITWTDRALNYFKGKEYRYFSPFFSVNTKGEVTSLHNIALTNWPATDQQRPLIALSRAMRRYTMDLSLEQLRAKAQELIDTFGAKGELMDLVAWLDALVRGTPVATEVVPGEEIVIEENATPTPEETTIAQAAYKLTGFTSVPQVLGAFKAYSEMKGERDKALSELRRIRHTANVEQAIKDRKLTPAKREEALKTDPDFFVAYTSLAPQVVDAESLTAKTNIAATKADGPTLEEIEADPKVKAWCQKTGTDIKAYAQNWKKTNLPLSEHPIID